MLALLERCVTDLGGTYAMEDTDSMAIVATQRGGLIECEGGTISQRRQARDSGAYRGRRSMRSPSASRRSTPTIATRSPARCSRSRTTTSTRRPAAAAALVPGDFRQAVHALPARSAMANRRCCARASITRKTATRSMAWASAQSRRSAERRSQLDRAGVAFDRAPIAGPSREAAALCEAGGRGTDDRQRSRGNEAAENLNKGKSYDKQIKPFNFILSCHVRKLGHPIGVDPERFISLRRTRPIRAMGNDALDRPVFKRQALSDQHLGTARLTDRSRASRAMAMCCASTSTIPKPSAPTLTARRAESKPLGCSAGATSRSTASTISAKSPTDRGGRRAEPARSSDVYTEYPDPRRDEWETKWLPMLRSTPVPQAADARRVASNDLCGQGRAPSFRAGAKAKLIAHSYASAVSRLGWRPRARPASAPPGGLARA